MAEESRVSIRQARKEANDSLKKSQKDSSITEDDLKKGTESIQKLTDGFVEKIDQIVANKEKDIMTI